MILLDRATDPFCLLLAPDLSDVRLSKRFLHDVWLLLRHVPGLSQQRVAEDVFCGLISRERMNHAVRGKGPDVLRDPGTAYAMAAAVLLRCPIPLSPPPRFPHRERVLSRHARAHLLWLLRDYGVQCADGSCCGLVKDPISVRRLATPITLQAV